MKINSIFIVLTLAVGVGAAAVFFLSKNKSRDSFTLRDAKYPQDFKAIDDLFHKDDNWYWMICTQNTATYSVDFMLRHKSSSQHIKNNDLITKVAVVGDDKVVGFLAYYPELGRVWRLLFLLVDQDFRRQGIAKKMLSYAISDMQKRGALRVDIATRNNNFKAQNLYTGFGCKLVDAHDDDFVHFSWYKQLP